MKWDIELFGKTFRFQDLRDIFAKANEEKSGDQLAQIGAKNREERIAAKMVLSEITLDEIYQNPLISPDEDEISKLIQESLNESAFQQIHDLTVGEFREFLLSSDEDQINSVKDGITSEMVAAVAKLMSNMDLIYAAKKMHNVATCNTTIGRTGTFSSRLQPNHPKDDVEGIMASVMDGLSYGVGDAVIGFNPVIDSVDRVTTIIQAFNRFTDHWRIPTQNCVLAHVTTQMEVIKAGIPVDLLFQSIAGSQKSNASFGIDLQLLDDAYALMESYKHSTGPNFMYFETGEGSALSSEGNFGVDQLTMEARNYSIAKRYQPFLINSVVGFIGPEYLYDGKQVIRAGLEDHFMGKVLGLPMGVDVCYTNHMQTDQNDIENLAVLLAMADCTYFMGVPCADDVMLMYQSTSYHDIATIRRLTGKHPIPEFETRMEELGIMVEGKLTEKAGDASVFFGEPN